MGISTFIGSGLGLLFIILFWPKPTNRFRQDLRREQRHRLLITLRTLSWLIPLRLLPGYSRSLSLAAIEELLIRAGKPWGLQARHIFYFSILFPIIMLIGTFSYFGISTIAYSLQRLLDPAGLSPQDMKIAGLPFCGTLFLALLSFIMPENLLRYLGKRREGLLRKEQGTFTEVIFMSLKARLSLREAIAEASKTTDFLQPFLQMCLNEWPTDKIQALQNLKRRVGIPGFVIIVDLLTEVADVRDEQILVFLAENKRLEEEIKNIAISARSKLRPLYITIQMLIPLFIIIIVLFYPLVVQVEGLLYSFTW